MPPLRLAVEESTSVDRYGHEWVLGNVTFDNETHLVSGRLGYPETEHRTQMEYDPGSQEFVERTFDLPDARSAGFVMDYVSGAIAFESDVIGATGFINHLVALLNNSGRGTFKGELIRIAESYREFVNEVDKVTQVHFEVYPTNPNDREIFRPLDEGMKASNSNRQRTTISNEAEELIFHPPASRDVADPNPAAQGIEMVEEGYGDNYRIDGEKDGRPVRFDSKGGGGLLRDTIESGPDDSGSRIARLQTFLEERRPQLAPGSQTADPLDLPDDATDDPSDGRAESEAD